MRESNWQLDVKVAVQELRLTLAAGKKASAKVKDVAVQNWWRRLPASTADGILIQLDHGNIKVDQRCRKVISKLAGIDVRKVKSSGDQEVR